MAADALSRVHTGAELCVVVLSKITSPLLQQIKDSWNGDADIQSILVKLQADPHSVPKYTWVDGQLRRKGRLVVGHNLDVQQQIIGYFHQGPVGVILVYM